MMFPAGKMHLPRSLSSLETWGFSMTSPLTWIGVVVPIIAALGTKVIFVLLPCVMVGMLLNLQVKRLGMHFPEMSGGKSEHPQIEIIKEYGDLPEVECYAGQLNQVFMNILSNSIDALNDYNQKNNFSKIVICTKLLNPDWVAISIKDNGSGMSESVRQKLFDPFLTTKPVGEGTGLGLSISYQIVVDKHKGKIKCISQPGEGAEFCIQIPIRQIK